MKFRNYRELQRFSRQRANAAKPNDLKIVVVISKCSVSVGANEVLQAIKDTIAQQKIRHAQVSTTGCDGRCSLEPLLFVEEGTKRYTYHLVDKYKAVRVTTAHAVDHVPIHAWVLEQS